MSLRAVVAYEREKEGNILIEHREILNAFIDFREGNFGLWDVGVWTGSSWFKTQTGCGLL
jgi:hypothetical protein